MQETMQQAPGKVTTKIFVGCPITTELKMYLNQSIKWKHVNILTTKDAEDLAEVHYHGKDFIGRYAAHDHLTVTQLEDLDKSIKQQLAIYCPQYDTGKADPVVFPQVFIA
jgi:hypothetical protein